MACSIKAPRLVVDGITYFGFDDLPDKLRGAVVDLIRTNSSYLTEHEISLHFCLDDSLFESSCSSKVHITRLKVDPSHSFVHDDADYFNLLAK